MTSRKNLLDLTGEFQNKKKVPIWAAFLGILLLVASSSYVITSIAQLLLLLLWGVEQTKLQIFVVLGTLVAINCVRFNFTWKLK